MYIYNTNCAATNNPSRRPSKLDEQDIMQDTVGEVKTNSWATFSDGHSYRHVSVGPPARTYLQRLCMDTECSLEDLPETIEDRDGWWKRELGKSVRTERYDDDNDDIYQLIVLKTFFQKSENCSFERDKTKNEWMFTHLFITNSLLIVSYIFTIPLPLPPQKNNKKQQTNQKTKQSN